MSTAPSSARPPPGRPPLRLVLPRGRRSPGTVVASLLLHAALLGLLLWARERDLLSWRPVDDPGPALGEAGGGGGGPGLRMVALPGLAPNRAPETRSVSEPVPPPPPTPEVQPEALTPLEPVAVVTEDSLRPLTAAASEVTGAGDVGTGGGTGGGSGGGRGTGIGPGTGPGSGPGSGGGGGVTRPPEPRQLILPPLDYPRDMRGQTIAVTFWVGTDGRVQRVALDPEIADRGFSRKFVEVMRHYRFRPARSAAGSSVPGTTTVTVTF